MSKKNKGFYTDYYVGGGKKKGKKNKKKGDNFRTHGIKPTLSGKEGKKNARMIRNPVDVPKEFSKSRNRCNHADGIISVDEFRSMSMAAMAYTPMLETIMNVYGPEHVHICSRCYDVLVDKTEISAAGAMEALAVLYASVNTAVANVRLKDDEIKELNKLKDVVVNFQPVVEILARIEAEQTKQAARPGGDPTNLNATANAAYIG